MDLESYNAHRRVLKQLTKKYRDKNTYPKGMDSENVNIFDIEEYWSSLHYVYLYRLKNALQASNEPKSRRLREKVKQTMKKLEECDKQLGPLAPRNNGLEHITKDCSIEFKV